MTLLGKKQRETEMVPKYFELDKKLDQQFGSSLLLCPLLESSHSIDHLALYIIQCKCRSVTPSGIIRRGFTLSHWKL